MLHVHRQPVTQQATEEQEGKKHENDGLSDGRGEYRKSQKHTDSPNLKYLSNLH